MNDLFYPFTTLPQTAAAALNIIITDALGTVFPACALVVIQDGQPVLSNAWGWVDPETRQHPCTPQTWFDLASLTKLFTVTAFLEHVAAGRVQLDDPVIRILPEFGAGGERGIDGGIDPHTKQPHPTRDDLIGRTVDPASVTFRHLLTHTSGLAAWRPAYLAAGDPPPPPGQPDPIAREARWKRGLASLLDAPFVNQPGREVLYSDVGLMLLGEAVQRLSQKPFADAVVTRLPAWGAANGRIGFIDPYDGAPFDLMRYAPTEDDTTWRKRRVWGEVHDENACGLGGATGHAGLFGTAAAVAQFGQAWLNKAVLTPALVEQAVREQAVTDDERRGLGWMIKSRANSSAGDAFSPLSFGHTGFTGTSLWIDPEKSLIAALLTNRVYYGRERPGIHAFRRAVHDCLARILR
ncbi:MAG: serine hydrolase domain-containing protein [bacterium]|nr:serine hydrolase domain-containing protein [bacterium]